jgi:C1A family cysteine protease
MHEPELETWGENPPGYFWVSYDKIDSLFSKYISRDMIDKPK